MANGRNDLQGPEPAPPPAPPPPQRAVSQLPLSVAVVGARASAVSLPPATLDVTVAGCAGDYLVCSRLSFRSTTHSHKCLENHPGRTLDHLSVFVCQAFDVPDFFVVVFIVHVLTYL